MYKCINSNEYFMYSELPIFEKPVYYRIIYEFLHSLIWEYPDFCQWYNSLFEENKELKRDREIIISRRNNNLLGVSILKKTQEERKICTLRVAKPYRSQGIGKNLMELSFDWLEDDKPLITIHKTKQGLFAPLFDYYGFKLEQKQWNYYSFFSTELAYNGILPEKKILFNTLELFDINAIYEKFIESGKFDFNKFSEECVGVWFQRKQRYDSYMLNT